MGKSLKVLVYALSGILALSVLLCLYFVAKEVIFNREVTEDSGGLRKEELREDAAEVERIHSALTHAKKTGIPIRREELGVRGEEIHGTVFNEKKTPIAGAKILATPFSASSPSSQLSCSTERDGNFSLSGLTDVAYTLEVQAEGFVPLVKLNVLPGKRVFFSLFRGGVLRGQVTSLDEQKPIQGAEVNGDLRLDINLWWRPTVHTDQRGEYFFANAPTKEVTVTVLADGYESQTARIIPSMERETRKDFSLAKGFTVRGVVVSKLDNKPIEGASVKVGLFFLDSQNNKEAFTDKEGAFEISGVVQGEREFRVDAQGYSALRELVEITPESAKSIRFFLYPPGFVRGRVIDSDGKGIRGATVSAWVEADFFDFKWEAPETVTDREGAFCFPSLDANRNYTFYATHDDYVEGHSNEVMVPSTGEAQIAITLHAGGSFSGKVTNTEGKSLFQAKIFALRLQDPESVNKPSPKGKTDVLPRRKKRDEEGIFHKTVYSDNSGRYTANMLKEGRYRVEVSAKGYVTKAMDEIGISAGQRNEDVDFELSRGEMIGGVVANGAGEPLEHAIVSCRMMAGERMASSSASTNEEGAFLISGLEEGEYVLTVKRKGYAQKTLRDVPSGKGDLEITLAKNSTISGKVISEIDGMPVKQYLITFSEIGKREGISSRKSFLVKNETGQFHIPEASPGKYKLQVKAEGFAEGKLSEIVVEKDGDDIEGLEIFLRKNGVLRGMVFSSHGEPLPGAFITAIPHLQGGGAGSRISNGISQDDGSFQVFDLLESQYKIFAQKEGYLRSEAITVEVFTGQETQHDFFLYRPATLTLLVEDPEGNPVPRAEVFLFDGSGNPIGKTAEVLIQPPAVRPGTPLKEKKGEKRELKGENKGKKRRDPTDGGPVGRTDSRGIWQRENLLPGIVLVEVRHEIYKPAVLTLELGEEERKERVVLGD